MTACRQTLRCSQPLRDAQLLQRHRDSFTTTAPAGEAAPVPAPGAAALDELLKASYERGRMDAEKSLRQQLLEQRVELQRLFQGALTALQQAVPQVVRDTEQAMITLAFEIARKLVGELPISARMVEASVRDALAQIEGTAEFDVRLHPADLDLLREAGSPLLQSEGGHRVRFQAAPELTRGGCLVQTRFGVIDARRETKFDLLKQSLAP